MPPFAVTPGGVALPRGLGVADVIPSLDGRTAVIRGGRGAVPTAPSSPRAPREGPLVSYQGIYDSHQIVASVVNKLTRSVARVPFKVKRRTPDGHLEPVQPDHPLVRLLATPSPGFGSMAWKQWMAFGLFLHGNSVLVVYRADPDGPPTEIFPLDWRFLTAYRRIGGPIDRWMTSEIGRTVALQDREVIHTAWWAQSGAIGQLGISPLEQLGATVRLDDAAQRHAYSSLAGNAHPGGAFQLPDDVPLTDEIAADLRLVLNTWEGVDASGTPILGNGARWVTHNQTAAEAELTQTRTRALEEVCMVYDVSPTVIGWLANATQRGNVAELNQDFYGNTLGGPLALMAEALQVQLVDREPTWAQEGLVIQADASEFLRGDPLQWALALNARVAGGGLTLNERREQDALPASDDAKADELLVADNNLHPLSMIGQNLTAPGTPAQGALPPADPSQAIAAAAALLTHARRA